MKKVLFSILAMLMISASSFASSPTFSPANTTNTNNYNFWFNAGTGIAFGNYPNADIYYDGTNLVIDVLHGGGTVSFPHGASITGGLTPSGMMTFSAGGAVTAGSYQIGRDNGGTNAIHLNAPTGATIIGSINGTSKATIDTNGINGVIGGTTPAAATFTTIAGSSVAATSTIKSTAATGLGWHILAHANQACNTTCSSGGCAFGLDTAGPNIVECTDATADQCACAQ